MPTPIVDVLKSKPEDQLVQIHRLTRTLTEILADGPTPWTDATALSAIIQDAEESAQIGDLELGVSLRMALVNIIDFKSKKNTV